MGILNLRMQERQTQFAFQFVDSDTRKIYDVTLKKQFFVKTRQECLTVILIYDKDANEYIKHPATRKYLTERILEAYGTSIE